MSEMINEIHYIYILNENISYSAFCFYDKRILNNLDSIKKILLLPSDLNKLARNKLNKIKIADKKRMQTSHYIKVCTIDVLQNCEPIFQNYPPSVIVYDKIDVSDILNKIQTWKIKPIILNLDDPNLNEEYLLEELKKRITQGLNKKIIETPSKIYNNDDLIIRHYTVNPIINTLRNFGFQFNNLMQDTKEKNLTPYIQNILQINKLMNKWLQNNYIDPVIDYIITTLPIIPKEEQKRIIKDRSNKNELKSIFNSIQYFSTITNDERNLEIECYEIILQLLLEKYLSNLFVINFDPSTSLIFMIKNLLYSQDNNLKKVYPQYLKNITELVPSEFILKCDKKIPKIKFFTDLPLEFCLDEYNKLPLLLSATITKLPTTPGFVSFNTIATNKDTYIHVDELKRVLVIRSFENTDPLKYKFEQAYNIANKDEFNCNMGCLNNGQSINSINTEFIFKDVTSIEQMIDVINSFDDIQILIFDCHGTKGEDDQGALKIGNELFNPVYYYGKIKLPPIIFLSACETYPLENAFSSVATSFLFCDVKSIIGTYTSIRADNGAIILARILIRLQMFLPIALSFLSKVSFDDFISMFFRMSFITDILHHFHEKKLISKEERLIWQTIANNDINRNLPEWYNNIIDKLAKKFNISNDECKNLILQEINYSESLKYINIGFGESVYFFNDINKIFN